MEPSKIIVRNISKHALMHKRVDVNNLKQNFPSNIIYIHIYIYMIRIN